MRCARIAMQAPRRDGLFLGGRPAFLHEARLGARRLPGATRSFHCARVADGAVVGRAPLAAGATLSATERSTWLRPISSTPCARRSARRRAASPACIRPISGRIAIKALIERTGIDPGAVDDVVFGCVDTHRAAGRRHRPHLLAGRRAARARARHDRRPAVRLVAAGGPLRRAGRDERARRIWSSPAASRR